MESTQITFQQFRDALPKLQESLDRGWQEYQRSDEFSLNTQLYQQLNWWYESSYYGVIPNPPHWYAAQQLAKYFLIEIGKLGIYFDTIFPGNFSQSLELTQPNGLEVRRFNLNAFYQTQPVGILQLDFIHKHETFYFTQPPKLSIYDLHNSAC